MLSCCICFFELIGANLAYQYIPPKNLQTVKKCVFGEKLWESMVNRKELHFAKEAKLEHVLTVVRSTGCLKSSWTLFYTNKWFFWESDVNESFPVYVHCFLWHIPPHCWGHWWHWLHDWQFLSPVKTHDSRVMPHVPLPFCLVTSGNKTALWLGMFLQAYLNLDFSPPIVLGMIVKLLPMLLNRPLYRVHCCKLYQDVENLVATENRQNCGKVQKHTRQIRTIWWENIYFKESFNPTHRTVLKIDKQKNLFMSVRKWREV